MATCSEFWSNFQTLMQMNPQAAHWSWQWASEEQEWADAVYVPQCCHCACCACPCGRGHRSRCTPWHRRRAGRPWSPAGSQGPCARFPPARKTNYRHWALKACLCNPTSHQQLCDSIKAARQTQWFLFSYETCNIRGYANEIIRSATIKTSCIVKPFYLQYYL